MSRDDAVRRAWTMMLWVGLPPGAPLDAVPMPVGYRLEPSFNGGNDPEAAHCGSISYGGRAYTADCIGFVLWSLGIDRCQPGFSGSRGEWLNCSSIWSDATLGHGTYFDAGTDRTAQPGDLLLTPDHIGLIVRPGRGDFEHLVVDCSPRHGRRTAIATGGPWSKECTVVSYNRFTG